MMRTKGVSSGRRGVISLSVQDKELDKAFMEADVDKNGGACVCRVLLSCVGCPGCCPVSVSI